MEKVKALKDFRDRENGLQLRKTGEEFEVSKDRAAILATRGYVKILSKAADPPEKKKTEAPSK